MAEFLIVKATVSWMHQDLESGAFRSLGLVPVPQRSRYRTCTYPGVCLLLKPNSSFANSAGLSSCPSVKPLILWRANSKVIRSSPISLDGCLGACLVRRCMAYSATITRPIVTSSDERAIVGRGRYKMVVTRPKGTPTAKDSTMDAPNRFLGSIALFMALMPLS